MSEKKYPPSKNKLKKLAREGHYPFSSLFHSSLFLLFGLLSLKGLLKFSLSFNFLMEGELREIFWRILVFCSLFLIALWVWLVSIYYVVGGKISPFKSPSPSFSIVRPLTFFIMSLIAGKIIFFSKSPHFLGLDKTLSYLYQLFYGGFFTYFFIYIIFYLK